MPEIYDISVTISEDTPLWPGDGGLAFKRVKDMDQGDSVNVTQLSMSVHTGTHVDAPCHFYKDGYGIEKLPLDALIGKAQVIEFKGDHHLGADDFADVHPDTERLLIKTSNSLNWSAQFKEDYLGIAADGAEHLVKLGIKSVGVDYLSVAPFTDLVQTHLILLGAEVVIIEGLNLSEVEPGIYTLHCLPIKVAGADGAPARAVLIRE